MRIHYLLLFLVILETTTPLLRGEEFAVVKGTKVNLRSSPSLNSEVIARLSLGQTVTVREKVSNNNPGSGAPEYWFRISIPVSVPVYVNASFIEDSKVTANHLNVRSGPGESFAVLARLSGGTRVSVVGAKKGWLTILPPPEATGFVAPTFLQPVQPQPVVTPTLPVVAPQIVLTTPPVTSESRIPALTNPSTNLLTGVRQELATTPQVLPNQVDPTPPEPSSLRNKPTDLPEPNFVDSRARARIYLKPSEDKLNRVGISYRAGYGITGSIKAIAPINSGVLLDASVARGVDRVYDDGFVGLDSSHNAGGLTWKWGYLDSSQISKDRLNQHIFAGEVVDAPQNLHGAGPQNGLELTYNRQLGSFNHLTNVVWGFLAGISQNQWGIRDHGPLSANLTTVTDSYSLGGIIPPTAPFLPCCEGPGIPLIDDEPQRTYSTVLRGASISGSRTFDADIYGLRIGPYAQVPLGEKLKLSVGAGLALGFVSSDFTYDHTLEIPNSSAKNTQSHQSSDRGISPGWYADFHLLVPVYKALNATMGYQYQSLSDYQHFQGGNRVELDLGQTHFFTLGLSYSY